MRRTIIANAILILLLAASVCQAAPQVYKSNVLTAQHVVAPGTHVAIVPPRGAVQSKEFRGFELASRGIVIEIVERMGASYASSEAKLTADALAQEGIKVLDTTKVTLNEKPATLLTCTAAWDAAEGEAAAAGAEERGLLLFVLGNERLTTYLYGYYSLDDRSAVNTVRTSLLSAIFQTGQQRENDGGGYTLSSAGTSLKFAGEASQTRYYTVGGVPVGAEVESAIYSATTLTDNASAAERRGYAKKALERYLSSYDFEILGEQQISVGGLQGIELTAGFEGAVRRSRTSSGGTVRRSMPGRGYQAILFGSGGRVYVFQGVAVRDAELHLSEFKRITSTFTLQK